MVDPIFYPCRSLKAIRLSVDKFYWLDTSIIFQCFAPLYTTFECLRKERRKKYIFWSVHESGAQCSSPRLNSIKILFLFYSIGQKRYILYCAAWWMIIHLSTNRPDWAFEISDFFFSMSKFSYKHTPLSISLAIFNLPFSRSFFVPVIKFLFLWEITPMPIKVRYFEMKKKFRIQWDLGFP